MWGEGKKDKKGIPDFFLHPVHYKRMNVNQSELVVL